MAKIVNYEEIKRTATRAIKKIDPSLPFGTELFEAILSITVSVLIEVVIIKNTPRGREVFLTQRKAGESYEGQWHCPGTFIRPGEQIDEVFQRLFSSEKLGEFSEIEFIGIDNNIKEERGHLVHLIYKVKASPLEVGRWFLVSELPENIVKHHRDVVIPTATK